MNKSKILKRVFAGILIFTSCFVTLMHNTQTASASVRFSYQNLLNTRGKLKSNRNEGLSNGDILFDSEKRNACPVYKITYKLDNDSQFRDTCFTGASVEGEGGFEIMVRDDEDGQTHWYGSASYKNNEAISEEFSDSFHGIKLSKLNLIPHTDKFGSTVLEVKMTVTNTNSYSKQFSLATSGDIQIADDDNAAIQRIGNGFIMTNKWCETSTNYLGDVPVATLTVAAQNAPYVTDADTVFTGHYHDRGKSMWDNNTLGDSTTIKNQTKHGGVAGANGMEDTGFAISWQGRTLAAGESQSFSYTIGIGEYKPTNYIEFDSMSDDLNWTNVTKQVTFSQTNNNTLTSTPTRTGYDFAGWWTTTDNSGAMVYDANGKCNNNCVYWKNGAWNGYQDITVYAHWTPKKYTITFNQAGATTKGTASTTVDFRGHTVNITPPKQIYKVNYHATSAKNSATFKTELQTNQFNGYVYTGYTISNKGGDAQEFTVSDVYNSNSGMVMHESSSQNNVHYFQFEIHDDFGDDDSYISLKLDKSYTGQLLATATGFDDGITLEVDSDGESIVELDNSNDKDWGYITDSNELRFYVLGNSHSGNYITVKFVILADVSMTKNTTIYDGTGKMQCNYNLNKNITLQPDWDTSDLKVLSEGYGGNPVEYWVDDDGVVYNPGEYNEFSKDTDLYPVYKESYTVATTKTTGISSTSGDGTYHDGDKVLINAVVQAGYNFDGWYLDNSKVTGDTSYSFTMTPGNKTFTAKATAKQFNITLIARFEQPDGSFKEETVIDNKLYDFGSTVSWSRAEDKEYRKASISWIVTGNDIKYVDVKRRTYNQTLTVQYENADGSFTNPETVINAEPYRYGSIVSWSRAQDAVYQKAEISWTVTGDAKENITVYRNKYTITVNGDSHIESTSGSGTYRYGTKITISATPKYGYRFVNWNNDSGLTVNPMSGTVTHDAAYTAYTTANNYTLTYNKGATNVAANNFTETYPYGKSVKIAANKFTGRSYSISFNSNGGSSVTSVTGNLEFDKWIDSNKTSWQPSQNYTVERDTTFTAQWKNKTVTFNAPTKEGYTFAGWYDGNNKIDSLTITQSDTAYTKQLTAHWQINKYPVIVEHYIMDTNGNYSSKPDKTVKGVNGQEKYNYNTEILSTACIDKSLLVTGGIEYDSDKTPEKTTVTADSNGTVIRIYYKRLKHTVTFNVIENGGYWKDNASNTNRTISVYYGNAYSSSSFDNIAVKGSNFDFKGWNTQYDTVDSMKSLNAKMGTGDITYYAIYSKDITTTFIDCQGARTVNVTIWNKDRQGIISVPAIRVYNWKDTTGCKPIGYNITSDINKDGAISAQVADNSSLTVSDNATYYAVYTAKATLVYDTKEGTLKDSAAQILVDVFCNANDINNVRGAQIKLAYCDRNPVSHDGYNHTYDFANWESSLDGKTYNAGKTFAVTKNMIMTAVWNETITPITYTIHFEKVLGEAVTNVPDDITAVYDKAVTIPDNIPVRTGFTFTGWALIENASADIISPGSTVKNLTTTDGAVVNLYAQWKQRKLVIVKASSTMYNDTIIRRTAGDDEWYNSVGKLGIQDLKNYPDDKCVQVWKIDKNGNITQTK